MESQRYLGIDWGEKRIGLATADSETKLALPFTTVPDLEAVLRVIKEEEITEIVLGSPQKMSGAAANNPLWQEFVTALGVKTACPVRFIDERLSSLAADALPGRKRDKAGRDEIAAAIILQAHLDCL